MSKIIKIKRGRKIGLPSLSKGELGYAKDTQELYIGDEETNVLVNSTDGGAWATPIVDITDVTTESVTFTIQNLQDFEVDVKYDLNTPPTANSITLSANTTSSPITISNLDELTSYVLYVQSFLGNDAISIVIGDSFTTLQTISDPFGAPGSQFFVASTTSTNPETSEEETSGFFGTVSQEDFGTTMTQVMTDLGITQGTAQFTTDPLLKFRHRGKIKYINQRTIRNGISWEHIQDRLVANGGNVYAGVPMTIGGRNYKVRLMRGWGQVSANADGSGTPNYNTGPLHAISFSSGSGRNSGVNWPTNTSPWNAASPNEWNTLMFPIHIDGLRISFGGGSYQTPYTPNWASYSNNDLQIQFRGTWTQETKIFYGFYTYDRRFLRGVDGLPHLRAEPPLGDPYFIYDFNAYQLRLLFELDETIGGVTNE